ncbi:MAG: hypothetical protein IT371_12165 [Deltaproteobacteria bacterium]|nr:hypothetical protein [Deltaproteobacteria bacterium]
MAHGRKRPFADALPDLTTERDLVELRRAPHERQYRVVNGRGVAVTPEGRASLLSPEQREGSTAFLGADRVRTVVPAKAGFAGPLAEDQLRTLAPDGSTFACGVPDDRLATFVPSSPALSYGLVVTSSRRCGTQALPPRPTLPPAATGRAPRDPGPRDPSPRDPAPRPPEALPTRIPVRSSPGFLALASTDPDDAPRQAPPLPMPLPALPPPLPPLTPLTQRQVPTERFHLGLEPLPARSAPEARRRALAFLGALAGCVLVAGAGVSAWQLLRARPDAVSNAARARVAAAAPAVRAPIRLAAPPPVAPQITESAEPDAPEAQPANPERGSTTAPASIPSVRRALARRPTRPARPARAALRPSEGGARAAMRVAGGDLLDPFSD